VERGKSRDEIAEMIGVTHRHVASHLLEIRDQFAATWLAAAPLSEEWISESVRLTARAFGNRTRGATSRRPGAPDQGRSTLDSSR
jgi:hypothetical protein